MTQEMDQVIDVTDPVDPSTEDEDLTPQILNKFSTPEGYKQINFKYDGLEFELDQNRDEDTILFVKYNGAFYCAPIPKISINSVFENEDTPSAVHNIMQVLYATSLNDIERASHGLMPENTARPEGDEDGSTENGS